MNDIEAPIPGTEDSTLPAIGDATPLFETQNLDDQFDAIFGAQPEETPPVAEDIVPDSSPEVSEEAEPETSDDDSNIDYSDDDDVEVQSEESTPDSVVGWDEMNEHSFEIDGKVYSANDLKAALGRQKKQDEAHNEVEAAWADIAKEREAIEATRQSVEVSNVANRGKMEMAKLENAYHQLTDARNKALEDNNSHELAITESRIKQVEDAYRRIEADTNNALYQQSAAARQAMSNHGFAELVTDSQRWGAFETYARENLPAAHMVAFATDPQAMAIIEKARLFDKGVSSQKTKKLTGKTTKTLKGGASKPAPKAKATDRVQSTIDDIFKNT